VLRACELCISDDVKTQNAPFVLRACVANRWHGSVAWTFLRQHWDDAVASFPHTSIARMVDSVKLLTADDLVADVHSFFAEHPIPQGGKMLDQILERQRVNASLRRREEGRLAAAL
jgi:puromycin-sensitive aminopeptidase